MATKIEIKKVMIKTDPTMLVCDATPGPWTIGSANEPGYMGDLPTGSLYIEQATTHEVVAEIDSCGVPLPIHATNARLICAAPALLKVAQKLLLWMEERMAACDFNRDDIDLYHELRQAIRTAGGFSSTAGPAMTYAEAKKEAEAMKSPNYARDAWAKEMEANY